MSDAVTLTTVAVSANWLEWGKFFVTVLSPFIALGGAVGMFFLKAKQERHDELRRERQAVYRDYLGVLEAHSDQEYEDYVASGIALMTKLSPYQDQISLMAPDEVAKASLKVINANIGDHLWTDGKRTRFIHKLGRAATKEELQAMMRAGNPMREARRALIRAMRNDIVEGTKVLPTLTDVEDLEK